MPLVMRYRGHAGLRVPALGGPSKLGPYDIGSAIQSPSLGRVFLVGLLFLFATYDQAGAAPTDAVLFRIFLRSGTSLVSYGEYVRLDDRVVFSMPVGALSSDPKLQLVTIPADAIDWPATDRYADSVRYDHFVSTRAEPEFAAMSSEVARALNDIALTGDPARRLQIAEQARRMIEAWPASNYGYRLDDVRQIVGLLDEVISELRAANGNARFDLQLVAISEPAPRMPLMPPPTLRESIEQTLTASRISQSPAERLSLLQSASSVLEAAADSLPSPWAKSTREQVSRTIGAELKTENAYARLVRSMMERATSGAARADVHGVQQTVHAALEADAKLGRKRPETIDGLLMAIRQKLEVARQLRLVRDQWLLRQTAYHGYNRVARGPIRQMIKARPLLEDIKALAGPTAAGLSMLEQRVDLATRALARVAPPAELKDTHALLTQALHFAANAVQIRRKAVISDDLGMAWDASSAAAAAIMLLDRVNNDLNHTLKQPEIR